MKSFILKDLNEDSKSVEYVIPANSKLEQVFESFTLFLKACGYNLDGKFISTLHYDDLK